MSYLFATPPTIPSDANFVAVQTSRAVVVPKLLVVQLTSTVTPVATVSSAGRIQTFTSALAAQNTFTFVVTNPCVAADSVVFVSVTDYSGTALTGVVTAYVDNVVEGQFSMVIGNGSAAVLNGTVTVAYMIL